MRFDYYEFTIADHYLSALINGDHSGLSESEECTFTDWLESTDRRITHWDVTDDSENFTRCDVSGLSAQCATVRAYFPC